MSQITRTYSFTDGTVAYGSQVESEISNIVTVWNNHDAASSAFTALSVSGTSILSGAVTASSTLATTGVYTPTGGIATLFGYRKPNLVFQSTTLVDVENNTGTLNQTTIVFPDGTVRSVTEDVSSTTKYRRFDITAAANFTSGTEDSGIRSGITEATNTWYAIYAVKSVINAANFVLSGDTTLPTQANFSTLNTRYGTNGWLYLGMIRNGDNDGATGDIISFYHGGDYFGFTNLTTTFNSGGTLLATTTGTTLSYTYSAGTGTTDIPTHIKFVTLDCAYNAATGATTISDKNNGSIFNALGVFSSGVKYVQVSDVHIQTGTTITSATSILMAIYIRGFKDPLLNGNFHTI